MNGRLLWCPPKHHRLMMTPKARPHVLICSLQPRQIETWRRLNRWADPIEMIIFTDDDPPAEVRAVYPTFEFHRQTGYAPHIIVNAPRVALVDLEKVRGTIMENVADLQGKLGDTFAARDAAEQYVRAVRAVGRHLQGKAVAWIQPESDHAIGAINMARAMSPQTVIAYSARNSIDSIGAQAAGIIGVNIKIMGELHSDASA